MYLFLLTYCFHQLPEAFLVFIPLLTETSRLHLVKGKITTKTTKMDVSEGLKSRTTKSILGDCVSSNRLSRTTCEYDQTRKMPMKLLPGPSSDPVGSLTVEQNESVDSSVNKVSERSYRFANGIREHVKGKLSLGAKILQLGGKEKVFKQIFSVGDGERLLKASQCCLSTTAGPITGLLFITTNKLAFCSSRPVVKVSSPTGDLLKFHYKVIIPLIKIKRASQSENTKKTSQKYLQVVTADEFEFWFMAFINYKKTFQCLQQALLQA